MFSSEQSNTYFKTVNIKNLEIEHYNNRFILYEELTELFKNLNKSKCLVPTKKIKDYSSISNNKSFLIDDTKILLKKRIGSNSRYGTIYFSLFKNYKFATKLAPINNYNLREIILINKLSNITKNNLNPHFLLNYKLFICNNKTENPILPTVIKKDNYYITTNELVNGNFKNFLTFTNTSFLLNALQQILLSILSFHYFTGGYFHNDCHYKNFLYLKIKPGGYFHYNIYGKDIYIKNMGYIWIIWDYGLVRTKENYLEKRLEDYFRILSFFLKYNNYNSNSNNSKVIKNVIQILKFKKNYHSLFGNSDKKFFDELFKIPKLFNFNLPLSANIINKNPYKIE